MERVEKNRQKELQRRNTLHFTIPEKAHPLTAKLFSLMLEQNVTYQDIENRAGVSYWTLKNWRRGQLPNLDNLTAAYQVVGYELVPRKLPVTQ